MTKIIITYVVTLFAFIAIDMIWLVWLARATYVAEMGDLLRKQPNMTAAVIFYLVYAAGLMFFAISPGLKSGSLVQTVALAAALGFVAYGTYDLTNLSVMNGFNVKIAVIDLIWGTCLSAMVGAVTFLIISKFTAQ
jgi:uncharacterized membrane protein